MSSKDPKPEIMRLEEVAIQVKAGEIKLPKFQRAFVWKPDEMLKLMDSIYKGYPIGSILIWNSSQQLTSERNIAGLEVDINKSQWFPTNYLLDGQQRLTTLCGALYWPGVQDTSIWNIHFDLDKEEFFHSKGVGMLNSFPMNRLINTGDFIRQCMKFEHHEKKERYVAIAEKLLRQIKDYKIAVVKIGDMTIEEVAPIFERINSTGRKLTIVDLMIAATWSNGFDLSSQISTIKAHAADRGFGYIEDQVILRSISAAAGLGINKEDIQKLRSKDTNTLVASCEAAAKSLDLALSILNEAGIEDVTYLPYGLQLTHMAEILRLCPLPSNSQREEILKWFWYTSTSRYFANASTGGQTTKDLARVRGFAEGKQKALFERQPIDISSLLFDKFNLRTASSTTFALLLNARKPQFTIDDKPLDGGHLRAKSGRFYASFSPSEIDRLNISKVIYPYTRFDIDLSALADIEPHLLDDESVSAVLKHDSSAFIKARAALICKEVEALTFCEATYQVPADFIQDADEISYDDD